MNIAWDAQSYARDFSFVSRYGEAVTELVDAEPGASVLDMGCGNGALTAALTEQGYAVRGMDASAEQLALARESHPHIEFFQADATAFQLASPVDVVFSNAVLHWIERELHPAMLACVFDALKPGGQFVFECGGTGCTRHIHAALAEAFAAHGMPYQIPFFFPTIGEYATLLESAGFKVTFATLFDRPTPLEGGDGMRRWIDMFVHVPFRDVETPEERDAIKDEAVERLHKSQLVDGAWVADYVRLRMRAVRG